MRVLFSTLPATGSFHPLVPLAQALAAAGHGVAFATARSYCPTVEAVGLRCFPAGEDWLVSAREPLYARVRQLAEAEGRPFAVLRDVYGAYVPAQMVPDLLALAGTWRPDVIVREPMEFAGAIAAEALGLPHAVCGPLFAFWDGAWHDRPGEIPRPELDGLRRAHGLPPDPALAMLTRHLHLATLPPAFPGPDLTIPPTVRFLRPVGFDRSGPEALPAWVAELPAQPTVHASLGTVFHRTPGVIAAIVEALRDEPVNLALAVGRDQDPADFGPWRANVRVERYIPHSLLLPHCDAVVTHGGFGSVMACLEHGLPMVVVPLAGGDQVGNARRCAALGVGRVVGPEERTPEAIRAAVREVLGDPGYRERAARLRDEILALPGPEYGIALLEQLVDRATPRAASA